MQGDSTVNQLTFLYNIFCQGLDAIKEPGLSFVTLVRPLIVSGMLFYYVNSKLLVSLGNVFRWSKNYLLYRKQRVIFPGVNFDWSKLFVGVPQGSILGLLIFSVFYTNLALVYGYLLMTPVPLSS